MSKERRTADRRIRPAVGEFAIQECARLRAVNAEPRFMYECIRMFPTQHPAGQVHPAYSFKFDTLAGMAEANQDFPEYCDWLRSAKVGESITTGGGEAQFTTWRVSWNSHEFAAKVAEDKAASFVLQRMIATAAERDVLDALIDAEALCAYCRLRAREAGIMGPIVH